MTTARHDAEGCCGKHGRRKITAIKRGQFFTVIFDATPHGVHMAGRVLFRWAHDPRLEVFTIEDATEMFNLASAQVYSNHFPGLPVGGV